MSDWRAATAPAKLNLALVVGPQRDDGKHEVVTLLERLSLEDTVAVRRAKETRVTGFPGDSLVRAALDAVAHAARGHAAFEARIEAAYDRYCARLDGEDVSEPPAKRVVAAGRKR